MAAGSFPSLAKSFHFTPDQCGGKPLHRCQVKSLLVRRYAAWCSRLAFRGYIKNLSEMPARSPGKLVQTNSCPCCHSREWGPWKELSSPACFGCSLEEMTWFVPTLSPTASYQWCISPGVKQGRYKTDGAITPALHYTSCLNPPPVTALQPEGLGRAVFTGNDEIWL